MYSIHIINFIIKHQKHWTILQYQNYLSMVVTLRHELKLHVTHAFYKKNSHYAIMSHCWGGLGLPKIHHYSLSLAIELN